MLRKFTEVIVAGADLDPGIRHADERLLEIIVLEARGTKHGARTSTMCTINQSPAAQFRQRVAQSKIPSMADAFHHPKNYQPRNREAITLVWMMARMLPVMLN
jgi:hypothetical protein